MEAGLYPAIRSVERLEARVAGRSAVGPRCRPSAGGWKERLRRYFVDRESYLNTLGIDRGRLRAFADHLRRRPPGMLFGHAHSLYLFAAFVRKHCPGTIRPDGVDLRRHDSARLAARRHRGGVRRRGHQSLRLRGSQPDRLRVRGTSRAAPERRFALLRSHPGRTAECRPEGRATAGHGPDQPGDAAHPLSGRRRRCAERADLRVRPRTAADRARRRPRGRLRADAERDADLGHLA